MMAFNITTKMTIPVFLGLSSYYDNLVEQFQVMQQALAPLNLTNWQLARLLAAQVWRDTSPLFRTTLLVIFIGTSILAIDGYIIQPYFLSLRRLGVPELKPTNGRHAFDYKPMLEEAAKKYPDRPWFFTYSGFELVVLPSAYVDEIRRLAARTASLVDFLTTVQFGGWKLIGTDASSSTLHKTASTDLARSVGPLGPARQQAAREAIQAVVGDAHEWKMVNIFWTVLEIVAATGAIGLVGEPLSRDPRWLRAVRTLPILVGIGVYISCFMPRLLRPLVATISYAPAWLLHKYLAHLLRPSVEKAIQECAAQTKKDRDPEKPTTLIHLLLNRYKPGELDTSQLIKDVITATFESTPTTAVSLYWMLTELVLRPDLVEELRSEFLSVLAPSGTLLPTQLTELAKMDSFMRESARVNTFHYLGLNRILQHDFQFSIGPRLPKGTIICVDQHHIHTSPELYESPEEFDALRFYRKRQQQGHETRHQYASNGPELLTWGDGPQACPGRMFAANTIKILLAELLLNYDLQMPAGAYKPERGSFPNGSSQPDMGVQLMVRRTELK